MDANGYRGEIQSAFLGLGASFLVLGATLGFSLLMQEWQAHQGAAAAPPRAVVALMRDDPLAGQLNDKSEITEKGRHLFAANCAHCHGDDASGDEGPDLHGVQKSDARITAIIQKGIKGEMPKFGQKFKEKEVQALIAFLRTLKK